MSIVVQDVLVNAKIKSSEFAMMESKCLLKNLIKDQCFLTKCVLHHFILIDDIERKMSNFLWSVSEVNLVNLPEEHESILCGCTAIVL